MRPRRRPRLASGDFAQRNRGATAPARVASCIRAREVYSASPSPFLAPCRHRERCPRRAIGSVFRITPPFLAPCRHRGRCPRRAIGSVFRSTPPFLAPRIRCAGRLPCPDGLPAVGARADGGARRQAGPQRRVDARLHRAGTGGGGGDRGVPGDVHPRLHPGRCVGDRRAGRGLRGLERRDPRGEPRDRRRVQATSRSTAPRSARTAGYESSTRHGSCHDGRFVERAGLPAPLPHGVHPKDPASELPVFDDDRHFYSLRKIAGETGTRVSDWTIPYEIPAGRGALRLGVQLCEDVWHQTTATVTRRSTPCGPGTGPGADLVINLSASPWDLAEERQAPPRGARGDGALAGAVLLRQPGRRAEQRGRTSWCSTGTPAGTAPAARSRAGRHPGAKPCWCSAGATEAPKTPGTP